MIPIKYCRKFLPDSSKYLPPYRLKNMSGELVSENALATSPKLAKGLAKAKVKAGTVTEDCILSCLAEENLQITCQKTCGSLPSSNYKKVFNVPLATDNVALFVWLEAIGRKLSV